MKEKTREKSGDHVTERCRGKNVSEISPGKRGEIRVKKSGEKKNAEDDPGIDEGVEDVGPVVEVDFAEVFHAAFEQHITRAVAAGDCQIDENLFELHSQGPPTARVDAGLTPGVLFLQKFPNRKHDKNGQSDSIADDPGLADFFLFQHAILLLSLTAAAILPCYAWQPRALVAGDF